jgi:urocanate hydratase
VVDGSEEAELRATTVLRNDPGTGIIRHVDSGYDLARKMAEAHGINIPMMGEKI